MKKNINWKRILLIIGVIYVSYALISQQIIIHDQKESISRWNDELRKVKDINEKLSDEKQMSKDEPRYLEKIAREKFGLIKKGETSIVNKK